MASSILPQAQAFSVVTEIHAKSVPSRPKLLPRWNLAAHILWQPTNPPQPVIGFAQALMPVPLSFSCHSRAAASNLPIFQTFNLSLFAARLPPTRLSPDTHGTGGNRVGGGLATGRMVIRRLDARLPRRGTPSARGNAWPVRGLKRRWSACHTPRHMQIKL